MLPSLCRRLSTMQVDQSHHQSEQAIFYESLGLVEARIAMIKAALHRFRQFNGPLGRRRKSRNMKKLQTDIEMLDEVIVQLAAHPNLQTCWTETQVNDDDDDDDSDNNNINEMQHHSGSTKLVLKLKPRSKEDNRLEDVDMMEGDEEGYLPSREETEWESEEEIEVKSEQVHVEKSKKEDKKSDEGGMEVMVEDGALVEIVNMNANYESN